MSGKIYFGIIASMFICYITIGQISNSSALDQQIEHLEKRSKDAGNKHDFNHVLKSVDSLYAAIDRPIKGPIVQQARLNFSRASLFMRLGDLQLAERAAVDSRIVYDSLDMQSTLDYLDVIRMLGIIYIYQGDKDLALDYFIQTKNGAREVAGPSSAFYATCLMNLGSLHWERQEFKEALTYFNQAEPLIKLHHGDQSVPYGKLLLNKGNLLKDLARYEQGMKYYNMASIILEFQLGTEHPLTLLLYNNIGTLLENQGELQKAELFYRRALEGRKSALGVQHRDYLQSLGNMARICGATGMYIKALRYYDVLLNEIVKNDQVNSIEHFGLLIDKAHVLSAMEELSQAEEVLIYVIDQFESDGSQLHHSFYANALNNLGNLYVKLWEYNKAASTLEKVLALRDTLIGRGHQSYLSTATSLSKCYIVLDRYDDALIVALDALSNSENVNRFDKNLNLLYGNLAAVYVHLDSMKQAITYLNRFYTFNKNRFFKSRNFLSDYELTLFVDNLRGVLSDCASQSIAFSKNHPEFGSMLYDQVLLYHGFVLDAIAERNNRSLDSMALELKDELYIQQNKLHKEYLKPLVQRAEQQQIEEQIIELEHELNNLVEAEFDIEEYADWRRVQTHLANNEVAVEFVRYRQFTRGLALDSFNYLALLIKSDSHYPEVYYLGSESDLSTIMNLEMDINIKTAINKMYQKSDTNSIPDLFQFIWGRLENTLVGVDKINFVPAGLMHLLNFQAIAINQNIDMMDRYEMVQVRSTRSLMDRYQDDAPVAQAFVFGGLNYDLDTIKIEGDIMLAMDRNSEDIVLTRVVPIVRGKHDAKWDYLEATNVEAKEIKSIFESRGLLVTSFNKESGTEEEFKRIESNKRNILHLATHGYFFDQQQAVHSEDSMHVPFISTSEHPMIRSGLIMSGANYAWKHGRPFMDRMEDGILTAFEISQMNLSNTSLVVLSACESGRGTLSRSEGVYGLQRAFRLAGAENIIMSLWQVPDYHTKELMIQFYKNWLHEKMSIRNALTAAQKSLRDEGYDPFYWAGFVLLE